MQRIAFWPILYNPNLSWLWYVRCTSLQRNSCRAVQHSSLVVRHGLGWSGLGRYSIGRCLWCKDVRNGEFDGWRSSTIDTSHSDMPWQHSLLFIISNCTIGTRTDKQKKVEIPLQRNCLLYLNFPNRICNVYFSFATFLQPYSYCICKNNPSFIWLN